MLYVSGILREHRLRYLMTSLGIALCSLLMLFLLSVYRGVAFGSVEYVRANDADLWILQEHATNILRSTSILPALYKNEISLTEGVETVTPVFFILASVKAGGSDASLYLTGYDPVAGTGGPPFIKEGRNIMSDNEIVVDRAFASKYKLALGDYVVVRGDSLKITGFSTGTNMFVIQYAFITLNEAGKIIGFSNVVSCFLVSVSGGSDAAKVASLLGSRLENIAIFGREEFIKNNIREMQSGIIPLLFTVTLISVIVLTAILGLILSISVLEKRKDFAVMKALGSPPGFIQGLIIRISATLAAGGLVTALIMFYPVTGFIKEISPEVAVMITPVHILSVTAGVMLISILSSVFPLSRINRIYPLEVFL